MWVEVIGDELGAFRRSSKVGFIKSELIIFMIPTSTTARVATKRETPWLTPFLSAYHLIKRPVIDKCQMSKISTSSVSVFFINSITTLTINITSKKYRVQAEPQVIVASGAQPTSVILSWIPVLVTNFSNEDEDVYKRQAVDRVCQSLCSGPTHKESQNPHRIAIGGH